MNAQKYTIHSLNTLHTIFKMRLQGRLSPQRQWRKLPPPSPFPLPALPSPGSGGRAPSGGGLGLSPEKIEIEIGFGAFWRIVVSKRQLNINIQIRAKRKTYKLRVTHNSPPPSPIWTQVASTSPSVDAPVRLWSNDLMALQKSDDDDDYYYY